MGRCGNYFLDFTKHGEFFLLAGQLLACEETLCLLQLVTILFLLVPALTSPKQCLLIILANVDWRQGLSMQQRKKLYSDWIWGNFDVCVGRAELW
jgi:hypothetical protein